MSYPAAFRSVFSQVWAIQPEKLSDIAAFISLKHGGGMVDAETVRQIHAANEVAAARARNLSNTPGSVAVLPIYGIINQRYAGDFSGPSGTSVQKLTQQFRQAVSDPSIKAIVFDVDSPGGSVNGVDELAKEIFDARKQKKIIAVSNCLCASAAYYLASQASEMVVSPSSLTGSIGVYQLHEDDSEFYKSVGVQFSFISAGKYKIEGNSYQPLDDDARSSMQSMVDDYYGMFTKAVSRGRGVALKAVQGGFGEGRVLTAQNAVKQNLADRVGTLDDVLAELGVRQGQASSASAQSTVPHVSSLAQSAAMTAAEDRTGLQAESGSCTCECESCQSGDCSACTHEGCNPDEEGCEGCGMASDDSSDDWPDANAASNARRLRLAAL